jgi:hypothetical protein
VLVPKVPKLGAVWFHHRRQVAVPVTLSVVIPPLGSVWPHCRGQVETSMKFSVFVPPLGSVFPHHRRQVAIPVFVSVLVPHLGAVGIHHCWQVTVPVTFSATIIPPCGPVLVRNGSQTHENKSEGLPMHCIHTSLAQTALVAAAPTKAARSGDHRAACAMTTRVCSRSRLLCGFPFTHHSCRPSGHTTAGKSQSRWRCPCTHHSLAPSTHTTAGTS